ncbi:MAG: glycosyltransferase, partial [Victivallales bacterium]|nr:glycosyltransferase [Victivallales bacterium]
MEKRKLNICHVITRMIVGGAQENTLLTIMDHLGKGHEVTLLTGPSPGPEGELLKNKKIPEFETLICENLVRELNPLRDISAYRWLRGVFSRLKPDVVHTHSSKAGILGRAAACSAGVPFVCHTIHGQAFHRYEKAWRNLLYKFCERWAARRCHRIFAVADAMVSQCVEARIADAGKYRTVYSGMELDDYLLEDKKGSCELRKSLGIPKAARVVITVARLFPLKGYEHLLPVAEIVGRRLEDVVFLIVGDGVMMDGLRDAAHKAGLNFIFTGLVPPA